MKKVGLGEVVPTHPEGTEGVDFRSLIARNVNAPNFYLRVFDVSPGGHTPEHSHSWEHEMYVVQGRGKAVLQSGEERIEEGDAIFVEPGERHMFVNDSASLLRLVCVIPKPENDR